LLSTRAPTAPFRGPRSIMACCKSLSCIACAALILSILDMNLVGIIASAIVVCKCCTGGNEACCVKGWFMTAGVLTLIGTIAQIILGLSWFSDTDKVCQDWFTDTLIEKCFFGATQDCADFLEFLEEFCKEGGILDMIAICMILHGLLVGVTLSILFFIGFCKAGKDIGVAPVA